MAKQLFIGLVAEGTTDTRFLNSVVQRTFEDVAFRECSQEVEVETWELKNVDKGDSFPDLVENAAFAGVDQIGAMTIVVHTDSDTDSYNERYKHKISPAMDRLKMREEDEHYCTLLTPLIAVRMIEAWMLADKELLKSEINTTLSDAALGIARNPETMADPKDAISNAIRVAAAGQPARRRKLTITDLYGPIGAKVSIDALMRLSSYSAFRDSVIETFKALHYL